MSGDGLRICRDCKWSRRTLPERLTGAPHRCVQPNIAPILTNRVTGERTTRLVHCGAARRESLLNGKCGPAGDFWEAR